MMRTLWVGLALCWGSASWAQGTHNATDTASVIRSSDTPGPAMPPSSKDTLSWRLRHSPRKATLLSAVLPGAGQVYNRKYWKVPIVAAGLGVSYWFVQDNRKQYQYYRDAYVAIIDGDPDTVDPFDGQASAGSVLSVAETYRRWRDLSVIACGLVYVLNVMDAAVDAHFVRFDVSEDLSLHLSPSLPLAAQGAWGVGLALTLR